MFCEFTKKVAESEIYNECSSLVSNKNGRVKKLIK